MKIGGDIRKVVIDASVAVKWFSKEELRDQAKLLFRYLQEGKITIFVPELLICELGNALYKGKKFEKERVLAAFNTIFDSPIEFFPIDRVLAISTTHFMFSYDITFYDAVYAALASSLEIPLVSADPKDHQKIKEVKVIELARIL